MMGQDLTNDKTARPIRVGIADDHDSVRAGLEKLLAGCDEFVIEGSVQNGLEAVELARDKKLDVLILDVAMPEYGALDVLEALLAGRKNLRVLIFTGYPEQRYALHLARLGVRGYLDKAAPLDEIVKALKMIVSGKTYFSPRIQSMIAAEDGKATPATHPAATLTAREFRIFLRLAAGEKVPQIAKALGVSEVTVSLHRSRLLSKLDLKTNSHVTEFAVKKKFLT